MAVALLLFGCERVDWNEKLVSQAAMPTCRDVRTHVGEQRDMWQDYEIELKVAAPAACLASWHDRLRNTAEYSCDTGETQCIRYDEEHRYDEEWATITFVDARHATVRFVRI